MKVMVMADNIGTVTVAALLALMDDAENVVLRRVPDPQPKTNVSARDPEALPPPANHVPEPVHLGRINPSSILRLSENVDKIDGLTSTEERAVKLLKKQFGRDDFRRKDATAVLKRHKIDVNIIRKLYNFGVFVVVAA
jgi:hypothetical protein